MKTGLTKRQKTTCIYFDETNKTVEIQTHNTALKKRLVKYATEYPDLCRQTDDNEQGGLTFEIDRSRFAVRLTAPYSDKHRRAASELVKNHTKKLGRVVWKLSESQHAGVILQAGHKEVTEFFVKWHCNYSRFRI